MTAPWQPLLEWWFGTAEAPNDVAADKGAGPALVDLVAGNVQSAFLVPGNVQQFVKDGRLRVIATTGEKRFARILLNHLETFA